MIKYILFDLDGTLLGMHEEIFAKEYSKILIKKLLELGYKLNDSAKALDLGMRAMVTNDGSKTNEKRFWVALISVLGESIIAYQNEINEIYTKDFSSLKKYCPQQEYSQQIVQELKAKGYQLVLATNPLFPRIATEMRVNWANLSFDDFILVTTYENEYYCKPNINYYKSIFTRLNCSADECLMIGNNIDEDMIVSQLGTKTFLLTEFLINRSNKNIDDYIHGNQLDLLEYIKNFRR